ncbi:AbiH family protein [Clostridium butyricum]|uniref:AbiH family protein n=1 Tax=Clostridium butyricum TaxID=1492 RepID=UPI0018A8EB6C|nr:AbiH family protein [Clostridium butyricum]
MNILLIGNGFDLAHKLPTKYTDFLNFIKVIKEIVREHNKKHQVMYEDIERYDCNSFIKNEIACNFINGNYGGNSKELIQLMNNNIWLEYFFQCNMHSEENWIDFESEISKVIQSIDKDMGEKEVYSYIFSLQNKFMNDKFIETDKKITYDKLIYRLVLDLNNLIRALEIYLTDYVEAINATNLLEDIKEIAPDIDKLISFNYTNTYCKYYNEQKKNLITDFIHGEAKSCNDVRNNNMVLGIDEYLDDNDQINKTELIEFKKFYQRLYKHTQCQYREWIDNIKEEYNEYVNLKKTYDDVKYLNANAISDKGEEILENAGGKNKLYIFGHSLDITDKDILRGLILNENVYTTIYYLSKEQKGQQIANLTKVIGESELIRKTGGKNKTIEFKMQKEFQK